MGLFGFGGKKEKPPPQAKTTKLHLMVDLTRLLLNVSSLLVYAQLRSTSTYPAIAQT